MSLGTQKFQFDRLLREIDLLILNKELKEEVFAQVGHSNYVPQNYGYTRFLSASEYSLQIKKSQLVITHGGTGAIISSIKNGKKVIACPRLKKYGEHVDDHQLEIVEKYSEKNYIVGCKDVKKLGESINLINNELPSKFISNNENFKEQLNLLISELLVRQEER